MGKNDACQAFTKLYARVWHLVAEEKGKLLEWRQIYAAAVLKKRKKKKRHQTRQDKQFVKVKYISKL